MQPLIELTISSSSFNRLFNRKFISVVVKCSCNSVAKVKALNYILHCTAIPQSCSFLCLAVPTASKHILNNWTSWYCYTTLMLDHEPFYCYHGIIILTYAQTFWSSIIFKLNGLLKVIKNHEKLPAIWLLLFLTKPSGWIEGTMKHFSYHITPFAQTENKVTMIRYYNCAVARASIGNATSDK